MLKKYLVLDICICTCLSVHDMGIWQYAGHYTTFVAMLENGMCDHLYLLIKTSNQRWLKWCAHPDLVEGLCQI